MLFPSGILEKLSSKHRSPPADSSPEQIELIAELHLKTERLETEIEKRRQAEARLTAIFSQTIAGLAQTDLSGRLNFVNDRFCQIVGRDRNELEKLTYADITHPEDRPKNIVAFETMLTKHEPFTIEKRYVRPDGSNVWVMNSVSLLKNPDGTAMGVLAVVVDNSERKRSEVAMKKHSEVLAKSNAELEQFAHVASHDLKEPLRMVKTYVQLLSRKFGHVLDDEAREYVEFAIEGANRMQLLIEDLLDLASVSRQAAPHSEIDLQDSLLEALTNLQVSIADCQAQVTHDPLPRVEGNAPQMTTLFQNLLSNAIKFRKKDQIPKVHISVKDEGDHWLLGVSDNGIGIKSAYNEKIFVIFQRLHTRQTYPGTGIGLSLCRKIVERHQGKIWVESEPDVGSTFYFTLPKLPAFELSNSGKYSS